MKFLLVLVTLAPSFVFAQSFQICTGEFALCAASGATLTGKTIAVNGRTFPEVMAVCPVLRGPAIADVAGGNMQGSCKPPGKNQVWSLYQVRRDIPQAPHWLPNTPAPNRTFVSSQTAQMSNLFSFSCIKSDVVHGQQLANCFGPANESPSGEAVPFGATIITQSPAGVSYAVGGPVPKGQ